MADVQSNIKVSIDTTDALASIKNLQRQISAFHTSMAKGGAAANAVTSQLQQNLINSVNATGKFSAQMRTIKTTTESFTSSLEKNKFSMGEYFRYAGGASKTFGRLFKTEFETINKVARENVKDLQTQYIKMGRDANGAMKAIAVRPLSLDMNNLATKTMVAAQKQAILNQLLKQGSTNLLNFGKNTQWAGRQLMVGFTIPLMALGAAASKTFMDMETQAIRFKKVYGDLFTSTTESTAALDAIKNLGKEFTKYGIAVSDTVGLASEAAAAGFKGVDLQRQTAAATRLSILGQVESQKALETTIALQNAFAMSSEDLAKNIDFLNAVENQTVLSLDDMSTAIPKAAPVIQQLGGDVKDLAFFMAAMKEGGINASEGANALKSGLASMINPTAKASAMLQGFGINIKKIVVDNKGDLKKTVTDFATALNKLDPLNRAQAIEQMFGKFQFARLSTLFANVTKEGTQAARVLDLAGASIQELAALSEKELGQTSESAMNKFRSSIEQLKLALVPVGEQFLKVITPIAEFVTKILDKFNSLGDGTKKVIVVLTAVVAGLGPVLLMTFGLLMNGLANIIKGFTFLKSIFNKAGRATGTLGDEVKYMTTEQRNAAAVASSLDQVHKKLAQTFSSEAAAVDGLTRAYYRAVAAQSQFMPIRVPLQRGTVKKRAKGKPARVGGTGNQDTELALLMPGETVIPTKMSKKYASIINGMISDTIPGYKVGRDPGSGSAGRVGKVIPTVLRPYSANVSATSGLVDFLNIDPSNTADVVSLYTKQIMDAAGVSAKSVVTEINKWRQNNMAALQKAANAVNAGADATTEFGPLVQKFNADMKKAGGPFSQFAATAERMVPKLSKDLVQAQTKARELGLNIKRGADAVRLSEALPGNMIAGDLSKPGNFSKFSKIRAGSGSLFGKTRGIKYMGIPRFMLPDMHPSERAYKLGTSQEHISSSLQQEAQAISLRAERLARKSTSKESADTGAKDAKAYSDAVEKGTEDIYVESRDRKSPHRLVPQDGRDDARAYNRAVDKELTRGSKKRRVAYRAQGAPPILPVNLIPPVVPPVIPPGYVSPEGPMYGPRTPTKYDKTVGKAVGKFRGSKIARLPKSGMGMGLSSALMMGSYMIPGKTGEIVQKVSMAAFALSSLTTPISLLVKAFGGAAVALGAGIAAAVVGIGLAMYLFSKSSKKAAEDIKEAAKRESEARIGSARAVEQFAKTFNKALPSEREFSRSNSQKIKGSGTLVDQYAKDYATEGNISTQIINQAAKKGQVEGIDAIAIDVANKAAILGLSPEEIAANIKAASRLIEADEVKVTAKIQQLLAPGGKDILKEPLTIDARLNYLNKQSTPIIKNIDKSINKISKIRFGKVNPLPGSETFDYKSLKSAAGDWSSIRNSWKGDFWDKALAAGKTWVMLQKNSIKSAISPLLGAGSAPSMVLNFTTPSAVESYDAVQERIQNASTRVSIAFMQQKEALALLNGQYADGQISEEEYNKQKQISSNNLNSLEKSSIKLVKQLNRLDDSGESAANVIKDLADQSLSALKAANPDKFNEITKAISDLPDDAEVGIYMGYTRGSLTLMDLAILPQVLKEIEGKTYTAAVKIIIASGLSNEGVLLQKQAAEAELAKLQQMAATRSGPDRDLIRAISYYQSKITEYERIIKEIEGVEASGKLDTDFNPYEDLEDGTNGAKIASEEYADILQKEIDALKAKRDAQKDANDEVQREIDLKMKLQDLANEAIEAKISGNYLKAAILTQQAQNVQMKFNQETELKKKDDQIAKLEARLREIENGAVLTSAESAKLKATKKLKKANGGAVKGFNTGGHILGAGTATSDSIPAYLSNGEYVIKADSVKKYGTETFDALNAGRFAEGGMIQGFRTGGLNRIAKSGISSIGKLISSKLSGSKSAVLNTRKQWLKDMNDLMSEYFAISNDIKIEESSNYEKMVFPKILDSSDLRDLGDPRVRSLNIVRTMEDLKTGNTGYLKTLQEVTPNEVRREVFGSLFARRAGLLAPENLPVTTGFAAPHQLGVFSRSLQEMSPGSISEMRLSEKLKLPQSKAQDDKNNVLSAKIYASLGMTSERSYRNAILDSMGFVDNHGGNLYINPIQKQAGAIDFGRIGDSGYSITQFADSGSLEQLKNKYSRQYVELPESERAAYLEGLTKAKATLSGIKKSEIEEMLLASGYNKSDMPLSIYKNYIDNVIKALQDRLSSKPIQGWDEILPKLPIDENWYKTTDILTTSDAAGGYINNTNLNITKGLRDKISKLGIPQYANGGAVQGFRTGGLNRFVSSAAKKMAFSIPNKINQIKNYLKVRSLIKDGMYHGSQPTGLRGEEYLQGKNILEGAETYDPHYGMGFFGTSSKSEAEMYAAGYNSPNNWSESFGSMNKITKAPFGKYVDFTRGTNSIKWQNYKLYQALGMEKDGYLGNYLTENLGDIMAGQNVTGSIMNRINDGMVPGDMASAKWLAWAKPAGVHTEEYMGSFAPKKPASLLDNLKSKFSLLNKPKGYNTGGHILGAGTATSDSIPAMLSDGEYVIRASSVKKYGTETFDALNAQRFSEGSPGGVSPISELGKLSKKKMFGMGAKSGMSWQAMEELEKALSLRWGANKNASGFSKWSRALGRVAFNALQGGFSGVYTSANPLSALIGTAFGLGEGIVGLAQSGSDYGVKGGTYSNVKGFNPKAQLDSMNVMDSLFNIGLSGLISGGLGVGIGVAGQKLGPFLKPVANKIANKIPESIRNKATLKFNALRPKIEQLSQPFANPFKSDKLKNSIVAAMIGFQKPFLGNSTQSSLLESTFKKTAIVDTIRDNIGNYKVNKVTIGDRGYKSYQLEGSKKPVIFQGHTEDLSDVGSAAELVSTKPIGILTKALEMNPNDKNLQAMLDNFTEAYYGAGPQVLGIKEKHFLDRMAAAIGIGDDGSPLLKENTDGFAMFIASLTGNDKAKKLIDFKQDALYASVVKNKQKIIDKRYENRSNDDIDPIDLSQTPWIHATPYDVIREADNSVKVYPSGHYNLNDVDPKTGYSHSAPRATIHLSGESTVAGHGLRTGTDTQTRIMGKASDMVAKNDLPDNALPVDIWYVRDVGQSLDFDNPVILKTFNDESLYTQNLLSSGLVKPNQKPNALTIDPNKNDIYLLSKQNYDDLDRAAIQKFLDDNTKLMTETTGMGTFPISNKIGEERKVLDKIAVQLGKKKLGIETPYVGQEVHTLFDLNLMKQYRKWAESNHVGFSTHMNEEIHMSEGEMYGGMGSGSMLRLGMVGSDTRGKAERSYIESVRMSMLHNAMKTNIKNLEHMEEEDLFRLGYKHKPVGYQKPPVVEWRSPFPKGHPDYVEFISKEQQKLNVLADLEKETKKRKPRLALGGLINQQIKKPTYNLPSFATGIDYLPNDMIAQLHQGERVLTKEENKNYSSSAPTTNIININGSDLNKKEIAQAVMVELDRAKNKNNKTNMVGR